MVRLLFQGHGSFRITSADNVVIYVDPFAGKGYERLADIILVTHQHGDHNQIDLVAKKEDCIIIQNQDALIDNIYQSFDVKGIHIESVPAYNKNHNRKNCVGYIITVDGLKIYAAGDTSTTKEMADFPNYRLDYALLPIDGIYNMDPIEATECANMIKARHVIPIHMKPKALFDESMAEKFRPVNRLIVRPGEEIEL